MRKSIGGVGVVAIKHSAPRPVIKTARTAWGKRNLQISSPGAGPTFDQLNLENPLNNVLETPGILYTVTLTSFC